MILTWREEIIDKITNGALTVWCEAVEKAISLIDGNRILDENIYISISDTSVNHSRESNELLTYCSLEGDDCTEISYYTNLPYSGLDLVAGTEEGFSLITLEYSAVQQMPR